MTKSRAGLALLLLAAGCVSVEEAPVQKAVIQENQRTVLVAFAPPGPFVLEDDSKGESAAKAIPGLALVVQSAQDDRDLDNSNDLRTYLPRWDAAAAVLERAREELAKTPHKGRWVSAEEAELSSSTLKDLNGAANVIEWRKKYFDNAPLPGRDYAKLLILDDALVYELNVAPGVLQDGEGNATPALWAVHRLYRAKTMRQLWRREDVVRDEGAKRLLYDFKVNPNDLLQSWKALAPRLASAVAASYAGGLSNRPLQGSQPGGLAPVAPAASPFGQPAQPGQPGLSPIPQ